MRPKISVITPSFNQGIYIKDTIESVLAQKYENFEHIVIDGGSTDTTVEVLKKYPHLNWVSEKDEGQSDALNKGLGKASGEIIAWINSDDWYAEGVFDAAVEALKEYPVVMGTCAIVNETGAVQYEVSNAERTWFDLLRYWVPYSIPTQPAIFFRRELLQEMESTPGVVFDKELNYTMDYDLWTRLAIRAPFLKRVEKRFAYYRMTETNKTGEGQGGMSAAEPEMGRVFKRSETIALAPVTSFSVIIPAETLSDPLKRSVESVLLQGVQDFEIIIVGRGPAPEQQKALKNYVKEKNTEQNKARKDSYLRYVTAPSAELMPAIGEGINAAEARHIVTMTPGALLGSTFLFDALQEFSSNRKGLLLPWRYSHGVYSAFVPPGTSRIAGPVDFPIGKIFDSPALPVLFVVRRIVVLECSYLFRPSNPQQVMRELIAMALFKGWHVTMQGELRATTPDVPADEISFLEANRQMISAQLVVDLDTRLKEEPFAQIRAQNGCALAFDPGVVESCKAVLSKR